MPSERFQFSGSDGLKLAATLDLPDADPIAYALFAHCFTCGKDVLAAKRIAAGLVARGIAVLRFDFTGLGASEGEFANSTFPPISRISFWRQIICARPGRRRHF